MNQILLILSGVIVAALFGVFLYREIFPEYKDYQNAYVALEDFRTTYTHQTAPAFQMGIKQIVLEREDNGPPVIDRCTSCHVALQIPYFSPTKIVRDTQGHIVRDGNDRPTRVPNEDFIWKKLNDKIGELRDKQILDHLHTQGDTKEAARRLQLAAEYEALKTAQVGEYVYDVSKALTMHPLIGHETYPFEFHPIEEYGCTSCHNGNGRGLTTDKAHGPVFDGQYEIEDLGPTPRFTEADAENDPPFASIFNHQPGESLVFQTEPLFAGALMQAKCLQCHQLSEDLSRLHQQEAPLAAEQNSLNASIAPLTLNYQRGKDLYLSQACYACHRIAGFARGGVGPELTLAGNQYPWYLKRKLSWPQGDLSTSTMPNMRFDQTELQDLMTFLLAQKGSNQAIGKTAYKSAVTAWEGGQKMPWENPVNPAQLYDLPSSMTIFATEGCAACHRLQGFESNVGFAVEKKPHAFKELYEQQHWFRKLFPEVVHLSQYDEELPGSDIVAQIEKHAKEIDERIAADVRQNSLLEQIERQYPEVIDSYYTPFRYASRAKDYEFKMLIEKEKDPETVVALQTAWKNWKERVHRVLMMYIQVYGLGRLIGPHLNWSGVYRTDEWLMEHFRNPSSHVPRSLMPVFPFDDTKFYALTYMLDSLAVRNRHALRQIWTEVGFEPSEAYNMLCAQCHGIDKVGNGALAEWIYPIPKNLHNAEFLRNLTKDKALYSMMHGVQGTPMPPWGEFAPHKPEAIQKISQQTPVMNSAEIRYLVDWLFSSLSGGEVIRQTADVPKWQYAPQDVLEELKKEGGEFVASNGFDRDEIFSPIKQPSDTGPESYYIKKEYYTAQNIDEGREFFITNCAVCHGNEADGNSLRAGVMQEAKPRMLTNLDWLQSRDDLRLLRSIKYGVPGTAMTPWGDFTNSLQRLQLVIFIRSLTAQQEQRDKLTTAIYQVYEKAQIVIEDARMQNSREMGSLNREQNLLQKQVEEAKIKLLAHQETPQNILPLYQNILENDRKLSSLKAVDQHFLDLESLVKSEKILYLNLGQNLISKDLLNELILQNYLAMILLNARRYTFDGQHLKFQQDDNSAQKIRELRDVIIKGIDAEIQQKKEPASIEGLKKLQEKLTKEIEEGLRLIIKQQELVKKLY